MNQQSHFVAINGIQCDTVETATYEPSLLIQSHAQLMN